jgi:outer membrane protein TolC
LQGEERRRIAVLNRLCGHALAEPIVTTRTLADLPDPVLGAPAQEAANAEAESPEIKRALLAEEQAGRRVELAKKERWPDLTVSAGVMPRGGDFVTMWQAGVAVNLPIWSAQKQSRAIAENLARGQAAHSGAEAIRQLLRQRVYERLATLGALVEANHLYRSGLLIQSEATVSSTILQYQVGKVTFASVLEALAGYLADVNGFLASVASAQQIAIAEREISLDAPGGSAAGGIGGSAMPGAGATSAQSSSGRSAGSQQGGDTGGASMSRM